ncbi:MAG: phage holin family protein [Chloroflexi bacterium]|nr:phage holin family protein [Chloroflexota bacterium]HLG51897.1 phage holin family protein [Chloroflexota bacterium]
MRRFVANWVVIVLAVFIAAWLLPTRITYGSTADVLLFALVLGLLDAFVGPVLRVLSFPLTVVTFGLFSLVINAILFWLAAILVGNVEVSGFLSALLGALIISAVNLVIGHLLV